METIAEKEPDIIKVDTRISLVECSKAFNGLTNNEKEYSYNFTRASWEGAKICYFQRSYESPALFYLIQWIFKLETIDEVKVKCLALGFTEEEWKQLTVYLAAFFTNCGNYHSFGDTKFVPEISKAKFKEFLHQTKAYKVNPERVLYIWDNIEKELYEHKKPYAELGFSDKGGSTSYYSSNMTEADAKFVSEFHEHINVSPLNTRVVKVDNEGNHYKILVCSYVSKAEIHEFKDKKFTLIYGDFSSFMFKLNHYLEKCIQAAANETQQKMLKSYIEHFASGDINKHKDSQIHWIKDMNPPVETNIGFIEVYLDPLRVRAEFEGFVAIVDKEQTQKLNNLVANAEKLITYLTWPKEYEIEKFSKPDFTSLEVVTFACSGTPIGINLPNYDDITKNIGFKNVNLGNAYGKPNPKYVRFMDPKDIDLDIKYYNESTFLIVAIHELLGHGTGKLFKKEQNGEFNFEKTLKHPFTNGEITTYYEHNETWGSKFGNISSGWEECRADCVGLFLATYNESLEILFPGREKEWEDIVYCEWLDIVVSAIKGLEYYSVETGQWGQSHILAAYAILKVLLEAGNGFVTIEETTREGLPYLVAHLDRAQIWTTGRKAIGDFLKKLQVYKSTADVENGTKFFQHYMAVDDKMLKYREIALKHKVPRRLEMFYDLKKNEDGSIEVVKFEETFEGIIKSHLFHYQDSFEDVFPIWYEHKQNFRIQQSA
jgi:dipeptidyl-peptidase-3